MSAAPDARESLAEIVAAVARAEGSPEQPAVSARISILRNYTIEPVEPFLKSQLYRAGIRPDVRFGGYDTVAQDLMDAGSGLLEPAPDILVLSLMLDILEPDWNAPGWSAEGLRDRLAGLWEMAASKTDALIVLNTFLPPSYPAGGTIVSRATSCAEEQILQTNRSVREFARERPDRIFVADWERLLRVLGEQESLDRRYWYLAKAPFRRAFLEAYALEIVKLARALKGRTKKCLVLDCDNTLWGGVVGEEGLQGIQLDRNEYPGKAYFDFQRSVLNLAERGVLICLCSKNNEEDVWEVLDNHPDCLVKRSHLAGWRVNWQDKATGIAGLAEELNLGLDSFVFVDDDPAQCELIRQALPEVEVLQTPAKLYTYADLLLRDGLFDTLGATDEDRQRAALYQTEARRREARTKFGDLDGYLRSLKIRADIHPVRPEELPRAAQLTQKTNQFNLTTRRYTEAQVAAMAASPDWSVWTLSARDSFGDMGLTGVLIARRDGSVGVIDTYLLSCRILGRELEYAFAETVMSALERLWGNSDWRASYIATLKNAQVAGFWQSFGFSVTAEDGDETFLTVAASRRVRYTKDLVEISFAEEQLWKNESGK